MRDVDLRLLSVGGFLASGDGTDWRYQILHSVVEPMVLEEVTHGYLVARLGSRLGCTDGCCCMSAGIGPEKRDDTFLIAYVAASAQPIRCGDVT